MVPALSRRSLVLHRLTLGANIGEHLPHLANAHVVRDLDFDLVVVDHLGDLADEPAIGDDGVAAPYVLDHFLMRLHALLLRAQDQEIHDHEDQDERQQRHQHAALAACPAEAATLAQMQA